MKYRLLNIKKRLFLTLAYLKTCSTHESLSYIVIVYI